MRCLYYVTILVYRITIIFMQKVTQKTCFATERLILWEYDECEKEINEESTVNTFSL